MVKFITTIKTLFLFFALCAVANAQGTFYLGVPTSSSSPNMTSDPRNPWFGSETGRVYYGAIPPNSASRPVIVFIHGYSSQASTWFSDNDMYLRAYQAGYRTAFVSVAPDKSMWNNGQLFNNMLRNITSYFGVGKVVVVAHSKGGVDTDAALIHYGAHTMVSRVVTLGSPHYGTALADLAHSSWTWWLAAIFGQTNDATYVLQSGYMNYFRSVTDPHVNNPRTDFRSIGGWGYGGWLLPSGWYLDANGGGSNTGGNDGVVAYFSTRRPRAAVVLPGYGDPRSDMDHSEIQKGNFVWNYIVGQLSGVSTSSAARTEVSNPNAVVYSRAQVVSVDKGEASFVIEKNVSRAMIEIRQAGANERLNMFAPGGKRVKTEEVMRSAEVRDEMFGNYSSKMELSNPQEGVYRISSDKPFVAIITTEDGVQVQLSSDLNDKKFVYSAGERMNYRIRINGDADLSAAKVSGILMRTGNIDGAAAKGNEAIPLQFRKEANGDYVCTVDEYLAAGVYNIAVNAENAHFKKSVISSVAVVEDGKTGFPGDKQQGLTSDMQLLSTYPNPFSSQASIAFELKNQGGYQLKIYDMTGKVVKNFDLSSYSAGKHEIRWDVEGNLQSGTYLCELSNGVQRLTKVMVYIK